MLTGNQKRYLRALAHHRKPVVTVGANGVTEPVLAEIDQALSHHELIKIKLPAADSGAKKAAVDQVCTATGAQWVQTIGRVAVVYRPAPEPSITLPGD
jgi:RNA-binding protein